MNIIPYDREAAVAYAHEWAYERNPAFADFSDMGGDCANFFSQALLAGGAVMNERGEDGWYYHSLDSRAPAWSGVPSLFGFLTENRGRGPFGQVVPLEEAQPGDLIQLQFAGKPGFSHSLLVVSRGDPPTPDNILIAAHSIDSENRPLSTYSYVNTRAVHIEGSRM